MKEKLTMSTKLLVSQRVGHIGHDIVPVYALKGIERDLKTFISLLERKRLVVIFKICSSV